MRIQAIPAGEVLAIEDGFKALRRLRIGSVKERAN
jgi:hypothetical protein